MLCRSVLTTPSRWECWNQLSHIFFPGIAVATQAVLQHALATSVFVSYHQQKSASSFHSKALHTDMWLICNLSPWSMTRAPSGPLEKTPKLTIFAPPVLLSCLLQPWARLVYIGNYKTTPHSVPKHIPDNLTPPISSLTLPAYASHVSVLYTRGLITVIATIYWKQNSLLHVYPMKEDLRKYSYFLRFRRCGKFALVPMNSKNRTSDLDSPSIMTLS